MAVKLSLKCKALIFVIYEEQCYFQNVAQHRSQITFLHAKHSFSETWGPEDSYHDKWDVYEYHFCVKNMNTKALKNAGNNVLSQICQRNKNQMIFEQI